MAEILVRNIIIAFIVVGIIALGGMTLISDAISEDPSLIPDQSAYNFRTFNSSMNKFTEFNTNAESLKGNVTNWGQEETGLFGVLNGLIQNGWITLRNIFTTFDIMKDSASGMQTIFGIPSWVVGIPALIIAIIVLFNIFSAIFQREI